MHNCSTSSRRQSCAREQVKTVHHMPCPTRYDTMLPHTVKVSEAAVGLMRSNNVSCAAMVAEKFFENTPRSFLAQMFLACAESPWPQPSASRQKVISVVSLLQLGNATALSPLLRWRTHTSWAGGAGSSLQAHSPRLVLPGASHSMPALPLHVKTPRQPLEAHMLRVPLTQPKLTPSMQSWAWLFCSSMLPSRTGGAPGSKQASMASPGVAS